MKLAVGFLTYNEASAKYLADFLPSLEAALGFLKESDCQVLAFDNSPSSNNVNRLTLEAWNGSCDESGRLHRLIKYLSVGKNLGFGRAYNFLLNLATDNQAEYFLIINPDTLLDANAVSELIAALDKQADLAAAAPKILRFDFVRHLKTEIIDSLGLILRPGLQFLDLGQGQTDNSSLYSTEIIGPSGAAGLFRLSALIKIGESNAVDQTVHYFDERFFMYKEDCDLAYRLFIAGYKSRLVVTSVIYHDRTATSSGRNLWQIIIDRQKKSRQIRSWSFKNQHLLFIKHWKKQNIVNRVFIVFRFLSMLIFSLILEQFNLKQYYYIWLSRKELTNIK
ncbi:MAG: glycosyltransferase family 2 protein [Patescibacteria group bacterium]|jgi:GT2 family glycosyltransferase